MVGAIDTNAVASCSERLQDFAFAFDFDGVLFDRARRTPARTSTVPTELARVMVVQRRLRGRCGGAVCLVGGFPGGMPWWLAGKLVG